MLAALASGFILSQAYRTVAALMAPPLADEFQTSPQALGLFAGTFHFAFAAMQIFVGIGIDVYGIRKTALALAPLTVVGALLAAAAPRFEWLVLAQALVGIGCAAAFVVCTVFVARRWPAERFSAVSGFVMGVGGLGMLVTSSPLAWVIELASWRTGFVVLAAFSAVSWLAIWLVVVEPPADPHVPQPKPESIGSAFRGFGALFALPQTASIVALAVVAYASFITLRGLWLGPLLVDRHGYSLVQVGHVALVMSLMAIAGPPLFGRFDPGPGARRRWMTVGSCAGAGLLVVMALDFGHTAAALVPTVFAFLGGVFVLQYADVRSAYPPAMTGRALSLLTMAMFIGVAAMQAFTGWVASLGPAFGMDPYRAALVSMAVLLSAGAVAYRVLPQPSQDAGT
jgi:predicted MFS family arabinose efflux permease